MLDRLDLTLLQYLKERRPSPAARCRLLLRCADLLLQVHAQGVCHYDVKAANFLMSEDGDRMVTAAARKTGMSDSCCGDGSLSQRYRQLSDHGPLICSASLPLRVDR